MKHFIRGFLAFAVFFALTLPITVLADATPGDVIVTLGEDLTPSQKDSILDEMDVNENDTDIVYVTNQEEHEYLGDYVSDKQIGTRAISSSKITLQKKGEGLSVNSNNITWVTDDMYMNAMATAGIEDANVYVTAPFPVSGTAALTGIMKAYGEKTGDHISKEQKKVANEELVRTAQLGDDIGKKKAAELMTRIKQEMAEHPVKTKEDVRQAVDKAADDLGVTLTDNQKDQIINLFVHIKNLNINWNQVQNQIKDASQHVNDILKDKDTQSFLQKLGQVISSIINEIKSWF
jgi:uncharacterized protein YpuA (DUF1002 family)